MNELRKYLTFWMRMAKCAATGDKTYYLWVGILFCVILLGAKNYAHHLMYGLITTNMSDQVSWGIGIANFIFFVGIAAAAVLLVFPAYVNHDPDAKHVVLIGEIMAVCAVIMCLLFIITDIGHPERFWHLMPGIGGRLNLPSSLLAWDVVVFNGYLFLNLHIPGYLLYMIYQGKQPRPIFYLPFVFISILWAVSIHTVTAFLLSGLGARAFWNTSILAPRFLISAFAAGPCILIISLTAINHFSKLKVSKRIFEYLKSILRITMPINLFLLGCEVFKEFYTNTQHAASAYYLYFGLHGHNMLTKFIWTAITFNCAATVIFLIPKYRNNRRTLFLGCGLTLIGIWVEKGVGLIFPGFIPTPLGEIVEYVPNFSEICVSAGILALGTLLFTVGSKIAIAIQTGQLRISEAKSS